MSTLDPIRSVSNGGNIFNILSTLVTGGRGIQIYTPSKVYQYGDFVYTVNTDNVVTAYRCVTNGATGEFNPTDWTTNISLGSGGAGAGGDVSWDDITNIPGALTTLIESNVSTSTLLDLLFDADGNARINVDSINTAVKNSHTHQNAAYLATLLATDYTRSGKAAYVEGIKNASNGPAMHAEGYNNTSSASDYLLATFPNRIQTTGTNDILSFDGDLTSLNIKSVIVTSTSTGDNNIPHTDMNKLISEGATVDVSNVTYNTSTKVTDVTLSGKISGKNVKDTLLCAFKDTAGNMITISNDDHSENKATHIEGYNNYVSDGQANHVEGISNTVAGNGNHMEGVQNQSDGEFNHTEGIRQSVTGRDNHTEGYRHTVKGKLVHSEGYAHKVDGSVDHVEGALNRVTGNFNHVEGVSNLVNGNYVHAEGEGNTNSIAYNIGTVVSFDISARSINVYSSRINPATAVGDKFNMMYINNNMVVDYADVTIESITVQADPSMTKIVFTSMPADLNADNSPYVARLRQLTTGGSHVHVEGRMNSAVGNFSHAEGVQTRALGEAAHAEGNETSALGLNSHAEGFGTQAMSDYSHVEGQMTAADGTAAHAEGKDTRARAEAAHAEGRLTIAMGENSHTEGRGTVVARSYNVSAVSVTNSTITVSADDISAFAVGAQLSWVPGTEGLDSTGYGVVGSISSNVITVQGISGAPLTTTISTVSILTLADTSTSRAAHAEGIGTIASGKGAHSEGYGTSASGEFSHTEGIMNSARGKGAHSEGGSNTSSGEFSHTEGFKNTATGARSHAEGENTFATAAGAHSEGNFTRADGAYSHAEGRYSMAKAIGAHAEGYNSYAYGEYAHVEGNGNIVLSNNAHGEGDSNFIGRLIEVSNTLVSLRRFTVTNLSDATLFSVGQSIKWLSGQGTIGNGVISSIDTSAGSIQVNTGAVNLTSTTMAILFATDVKDDTISVSAHVEGKGSGVGAVSAHAEGSATIAIGANSHAEGYQTRARGANSHAEGQNTNATGTSSHSEGSNTKATGSYSHAEGSNTTAIAMSSHAEGSSSNASGIGSHAEGQGTTASGPSSHAEGSSSIASGDSAHAEGSNTTASGPNAHTEGSYTIAAATNGHTEGSNNLAAHTSAIVSVDVSVSGKATITLASSSEANMYPAQTQITWSNVSYNSLFSVESVSGATITVVVPDTNKSSLQSSKFIHKMSNISSTYSTNIHIEGANNRSGGSNAHVEGLNNTNTGDYAHVEGTYNTNTGLTGHVGGTNNMNSGSTSYVTGDGNNNAGRANMLSGVNNTVTSTSTQSVASGNGNTVAATSARVSGAANNIDRYGQNSDVSGGGNYVNAPSMIVGGTTNKITGTAGQSVITGAGNLFAGGNSIISGQHNAIGNIGDVAYIESHDPSTKSFRVQNVFSVSVGDTVAIQILYYADKSSGTVGGSIMNAKVTAIDTSVSPKKVTIDQTWQSNDELRSIMNITTTVYSQSKGNSLVVGENNLVDGSTGSLAAGLNNKVRLQYSIAVGEGLVCRNEQMNIPFYTSALFGRYGKTTDQGVLALANGTSSTDLGLAFIVQSNGQVKADGAYSSAGADYAEHYEWADKNTTNEDRVGYFVTFDEGIYIRKATSEDDYILGVVSATPSIIGDSHMRWKNKYIVDEWGRIQHEMVHVEEVTEQHTITHDNGSEEKITRVVIPSHYEWRPKLNPDWNNDEPYVDRETRPEFSAIGTHGKLRVRHDGSAEVNAFVLSNDEGIATKTDDRRNGYRVIEKHSDNIITIVLK